MSYGGYSLPPELLAAQIQLNRINNAILDTLRLQIAPPGYATRTLWKQVRFPRSKKKRIRKKWAKNQNNWGMVVQIVKLYKD